MKKGDPSPLVRTIDLSRHTQAVIRIDGGTAIHIDLDPEDGSWTITAIPGLGKAIRLPGERQLRDHIQFGIVAQNRQTVGANKHV